MSHQVGVGRSTLSLVKKGKSPRKLRAKLRDPLGPAQVNEASYHRLCLAPEEFYVEDIPSRHSSDEARKVLFGIFEISLSFHRLSSAIALYGRPKFSEQFGILYGHLVCLLPREKFAVENVSGFLTSLKSIFPLRFLAG